MDHHGYFTLSAEHLDIIAATYDLVCAELEDLPRLASMLHADVSREWPPGEYDRGAQEFFRDLLRKNDPETTGWYQWYAVRKGTSRYPTVLAGAGGFLGPPDIRGEVEIGFSVVPSLRGYGIATELAGTLTAWALSDTRVRRVIAHTSEHNTTSRKVLEKSGFTHTGNGDDPEHIRYERRHP